MSNNTFINWSKTHSGWLLIVVACAIPIGQFLTIHPLDGWGESWYMLFANFGRVAGLIGFILYAINMVLSIRRRWLEGMFGGLNRVYIAHHITGGIALSVLMFHPLLLAIRYVQTMSLEYAAQQLLPASLEVPLLSPDMQQAISFNSGVLAFWGMVVLLIITFYAKLPYRIWLFTHRFLGVAFLFAGIHVLFINSDVQNNTFLFWYMAAWIVIGLAAYAYRTLLSNIVVRRAPYKIDAMQVIADSVVAVEMTPMEKPINFEPGQFVFVRFLWSDEAGVSKEVHPFSIASAPTENTLRLCMKSLGDYTRALKRLKVGTVAEIEGAFGRFSYTRFGNTPQIWIAGGIGVTPFLSMARSLSAHSPQIDMFYSVQKRYELIDQYVLTQFLPHYYPQFRYNAYVSEEQGHHISAQYVADTAGGLDGKEIFICGPPPMMKSLRAQFKKMGVPSHKIHTEEFTMS